MQFDLATKRENSREPDVLAAIAALIPAIQGRAGALDKNSRFPSDDLAALREAGAYSAVLPERLGGLGFGTEAVGALGLLQLLRLIGRGNLAVGRLYEGHVNALALIALYGTEDQLRRAGADAAEGNLFAIWNTEDGEGLRVIGDLADARLRGSKCFCSAAGYATRAVVTAKTAAGTDRLLMVELDRVRIEPMSVAMQGMKASLVSRVFFDDMPVDKTAFIGEPGDYLKEPAFSAGAWRTSAVTLGGLEELLALARRQLVDRGREQDPHQQSRMGRAMIAEETARLWLFKAAETAEDPSFRPTGQKVAYVNLARIAVENATLDAMRLVQRSLGLSSFLQPNPIERILRDLGTYLRQPAPDAVLTESATWFMANECNAT